MKYQLINLNQIKCKKMGAGVFGRYYRLTSRKGIKIFKNFVCHDRKSAEACIWDATEEAINIKKASKSGLTPKLYGVCVAKVGKRYYPAILMQHFENYIQLKKIMDCRWVKPRYKFNKEMSKVFIGPIYSSEDNIRKILKKKTRGGDYGDLHEYNIMVKLKHNTVVDFRVVDLSSIRWTQK